MASSTLERGVLLLTFAGGSVKCAVLKASFACRREERSSGFAQVPQNSRPAGCPCLFSLVLRTSSQSSPKQEFNPEKCSLRSLLQHPLCPRQQGPSLTVQPILFLFFSLKGKLSNTANQGQEMPSPPSCLSHWAAVPRLSVSPQPGLHHQPAPFKLSLALLSARRRLKKFTETMYHGFYCIPASRVIIIFF